MLCLMVVAISTPFFKTNIFDLYLPHFAEGDCAKQDTSKGAPILEGIEAVRTAVLDHGKISFRAFKLYGRIQHMNLLVLIKVLGVVGIVRLGNTIPADNPHRI